LYHDDSKENKATWWLFTLKISLNTNLSLCVGPKHKNLGDIDGYRIYAHSSEPKNIRFEMHPKPKDKKHEV
jgi:hypothetical protein